MLVLGSVGDIVDGRNPANQLRLVVCPLICRVLCSPGAAGFLPSTVRIDSDGWICFMYFPVQNVSCSVGVCIFFYLVTLQIRPSLYTGVIKLLDLGGIFINAPILRVFFSLKKHCLGRFHIHPRNFTWNLKISPWKRKVLLETMIFRFHVKIWGCNELFVWCFRRRHQQKPSLTIIESIGNLTIQQYCGVLHGNLNNAHRKRHVRIIYSLGCHTFENKVERLINVYIFNML